MPLSELSNENSYDLYSLHTGKSKRVPKEDKTKFLYYRVQIIIDLIGGVLNSIAQHSMRYHELEKLIK
jgi:hypothetical protein